MPIGLSESDHPDAKSRKSGHGHGHGHVYGDRPRIWGTALTSVDVEVHRAAGAVDAHGEMLESAKPRIGSHHLLGRAHFESVDVLQTIAVFETESGEQRARADAEDANADDVAILLLGNDARRFQEFERVGEHAFDRAALDARLVRAGSSNCFRDVVRGRRDRIGSARVVRSGDRAQSEGLDLATRIAFREHTRGSIRSREPSWAPTGSPTWTSLGLSPALVVTAASDHNVVSGNEAMSVAPMPRHAARATLFRSRSRVRRSPGTWRGRTRGRELSVSAATTEAFCSVAAAARGSGPRSLAAQSCEIPEA